MVFETEVANDKSAILSQGIIVLILLILGMIGNGILIVAYWRDYRMQTPTNMLVISHISAEFSFAVNGIFVYGSSLIRLKVLSGNLCIFAGTVDMCLFFVSLLSLTAIAVDRYFAVVKKSHHKFTKKTVKRVVIFIWSQAVVSSIPWDLILINKPGKRFIAWVLGNCEKYLTLQEHYNMPVIALRIVLWTLSFFIPCCIIFYATAQIFRSTLRKRVRVHMLESPPSPVDSYSRSAYTTIIIISVHFLCLFPSLILYIFREESSSYYSLTLHSFAKVAMSLRSVCYPVIFIARNQKFSQYVRSFVAKKFRFIQCTDAEIRCCIPSEFEIGTASAIASYTYTNGEDPDTETRNANKPVQIQMTLFRGTPIKMAFTDLSRENVSETCV